MKLSLRYSEMICGKFSPGPLNLMMIFQVNCPGCFIHAFPLMRALHEHYHERISCFALSTAFEDFNLNTTENTRLLISSNQFTGETRKAHDAKQFQWTDIPFPVLMDEIIPQSGLLHPEFIENIISQRPEWNNASVSEKVSVKSSLQNYFRQLPQCGFTFAANLMHGTPSFFLFDGSLQVLLQWFGHANQHLVEKELKGIL